MAYTSVKISADSSSYQSQMKSAASQMKVLSAEYTTADKTFICSDESKVVRVGNRQPQGKSRIAHSKNHGAEKHREIEQ